MEPIAPRDAQPGDVVVNAARENLPVFRLLTAPDQYGYCKAARLGGKRASTVACYPSNLPAHLRLVRGAA